MQRPDQPVLTVSLPAIVTNWRLLKSKCPGTCGATVKADAYGMGLEPIARALFKAGCQQFFVATVEEGITLRAHLPEPDIFVFSGLASGSPQPFVDNRLTPVLNSPADVAAWPGAQGTAALHVDTGMARLGCSAEDWADLLASPESLQAANVTVIMTHLACADTPEHPMNDHQRSAIAALTEQSAGRTTSFGNSAGILNGPDFVGDLARPGIGLYGGNPRPALSNPMATVVRLTAPLLQCRTLKQGASVGYGATYQAQSDMRIGTIAIGYADALLRGADTAAYVLVGGAKCPLIGTVSMDSAIIDLTQAPDAAPGDETELIGETPVSDWARWAGTIDYVILTSLGARVARQYESG